MTDTLDAAWRALPLDLYRLMCEYLPHGPPHGPRVDHVVIYEHDHPDTAEKIITSHYSLGRVIVYGEERPRVLTRCSQEEYPAVWRYLTERPDLFLGYHVKCDQCCQLEDGARERWTHGGWDSIIHDD